MTACKVILGVRACSNKIFCKKKEAQSLGELLRIQKLFPNLASGLTWKQTWLSHVGLEEKNNNLF
jgi:hypothetical protein